MDASDLIRALPKCSCEEGANGMDPALGLGWDVEVSTAEQETSMQIVRIGFDLAKYVFDIHGVDARGKDVVRKLFAAWRIDVFRKPAAVPRWDGSLERRALLGQGPFRFGHDVRLISPQFVTPYVKSNKNDRNDAEAICEAVGRPNMRFVPFKSAEQLAVQAVHRIAVAWSPVGSGSSTRSVAFSVNTASSLQRTSAIFGAPSRALLATKPAVSTLVRALIGELREELTEFDGRIAGYDRKILKLYRNSETCQRLGKVEGIGPMTATALVAAAGDEDRSRMGDSLRRGSALSRNSDRVVADRGYWASVSVEIAIFAPCSSTALAPRWAGLVKSRTQEVSGC